MDHGFKAIINRFLHEKNYLLRYNILHRTDGTGLADIFASDFQASILLRSGCPVIGDIHVSALCFDLPGGNKKLSDDEIFLVDSLLANNVLGFDPGYTATHRSEAYKYCIKNMKAAYSYINRESAYTA